MTYPVTSSTSLVEMGDYNLIYENLEQVLGPNEDGWGLYSTFSTPVTKTVRVRGLDWRNLQRDLIQVAYLHITNTTTVLTSAVQFPTTSTLITADFHNQLYNTSTWVLANRYVCAEQQYAPLNVSGGQSSRTVVWGVEQNQIVHKVKVVWASRLSARYFFNTGGYLTWNPGHSDNGINDLDQEWANFIVSINNDQLTNPLKYGRDRFINQTPGTTSTLYTVNDTGIKAEPDPTYESGTLSVTVDVFKSENEEWVEFQVSFANNDSALLVVTPAVGYWSFEV